jgi:hypothetical protein
LEIFSGSHGNIPTDVSLAFNYVCPIDEKLCIEIYASGFPYINAYVGLPEYIEEIIVFVVFLISWR